MFGQRKLKRILAIVEDIKFSVDGWASSVRRIDQRLDSLTEVYDQMAGEIEALREVVNKIDQTSDALIALVQTQILKIDQLLAAVAEMSDDAAENAALKEGIVEVRNALQIQVEQNEAALTPPISPPAG